MANYRTQKVNHDIQRLISQIIREEINDPRVSNMCTVLRADVTKDLKHAKVYISTISEDHSLEETVKALNKAAGFIKHRLSETMHTRSVPTLKLSVMCP